MYIIDYATRVRYQLRSTSCQRDSQVQQVDFKETHTNSELGVIPSMMGKGRLSCMTSDSIDKNRGDTYNI